jgi:aldose 1-epimerase
MKRNFGFICQMIMILACFSCNVQINSKDSEDIDSTVSRKINLNKSASIINKPASVKPGIMKEPFGKVNQQDVYLYTLTNSSGIKVKITNYGAIITSVSVPDKTGRFGDIVLGYDSLSGYLTGSPYFGALVGRYANRISKGTFRLNGKSYKLAVNNGNNSLHGGLKGFDKVVWDAADIKDSSKAQLELTYLSKDGEEGYPGNLKVKVIYSLDDHNELTTLIEAETDKPTPVNLCNHTYFNLSEADTSILGHILTLYADQYTPVNSELIPTGVLAPVAGTAMDFNNTIAVGERIDKVKGGYDHNYVLKKKAGTLAMAAQVYDPRTGRQVEILTTQPGVQFYTGNFLDGTIRGKGGKVYQKHYGLCLETQHFPDSPNQPSFPNTILKPGEKFSEKTVYRFTVVK